MSRPCPDKRARTLCLVRGWRPCPDAPVLAASLPKGRLVSARHGLTTLLPPRSALCAAPQQPCLCFAHLSHYCLLWNGTVKVSDGDKSRWTSTPSFVWCLFCYPSLTLSLSLSLHLWEASRARALSSSQVYTLEGEKSFKQTASLLFGQTSAL